MGKGNEDVTGIILAGGLSSRMGKNKALLEVGGKRIIDAEVALLKSIFKEVIVVASSPSGYQDLGVRVVTDIFPGKGSLGGVYTGLYYSSKDYSFIVSCDMPFLKVEVIEYLIGLRDDFDVVVPRMRDGYEPLHAVYSKRCLRPIEAMIKKDDLRIKGFYPQVNVREVNEDEISPFNPAPSSFININTPDDYEDAVKRVTGSL